MGWMISGSNPSRGTRFFFSTKNSDQVVGPTQPPIQWVQVCLSLVVKSLGHEPEHLHLMPRLMNGAAPPLPLMPSWFTERQLYFFDYSN